MIYVYYVVALIYHNLDKELLACKDTTILRNVQIIYGKVSGKTSSEKMLCCYL